MLWKPPPGIGWSFSNQPPSTWAVTRWSRKKTRSIKLFVTCSVLILLLLFFFNLIFSCWSGTRFEGLTWPPLFGFCCCKVVVYVKVHLGCWNSTQSILAWLQVSLDFLWQSLTNLIFSWKLSTIVKYVCRLRARATKRRTSCTSGTTSSPGGTEKGSKSAKQRNTLTIPGLSPHWKPQPNRWSKRLLRWPSGATPSPTPTTSTTWTSGESCREYNPGQLSRDKYVIQLWTDASNPSDPTIKTVAENGFKMIFR